MFNYELILKDFKKGFKKGQFIFCKDDEFYYISDSIIAIKIKKHFIDNNNNLKSDIISLIGSLDNNVRVQKGSKSDLRDQNVLKNLIDQYDSKEFFNAIDSNIIIANNDDDKLLRLFNSDSNYNTTFSFINNDFIKYIKDKDDSLKVLDSGTLLKQVIDDNVMLILGFKIHDKNKIPSLLREVLKWLKKLSGLNPIYLF